MGNFDGVHAGHAQLIERLRTAAKRCGGPAVVLTFDPHPLELLQPQSAPIPLTCAERKTELLTKLGVDAVWAYPTDWNLLRLEPGQFFHQILKGALAARVMVEGPNFRFGRNREGNVTLLERLCQQAAITCEIVTPVETEGTWVSSSRIRDLLARGEIAAANKLLTQPYQLSGQVAVGSRRGNQIGFPTANLTNVRTLVPQPGVYAGLVAIAGQTHAAAINIGSNPTFGEAAQKLEVHLLDWSGDLYGQTLAVDIVARLRDIQQFAGVSELVAQLQQDVARTRELVSLATDQ